MEREMDPWQANLLRRVAHALGRPDSDLVRAMTHKRALGDYQTTERHCADVIVQWCVDADKRFDALDEQLCGVGNFLQHAGQILRGDLEFSGDSLDAQMTAVIMGIHHLGGEVKRLEGLLATERLGEES